MFRYGANYTATLVNSQGTFEYDSLSDVISDNARVCMIAAIKDEILFRYPQLPKSQISTFSSSDDIFDILLRKDDDFCDAAVLHGHDYESYVHLRDPSHENDSFCFDIGIASDEVLMELENVIYYSNVFVNTTVGIEFVEELDYYINTTLYVSLHFVPFSVI